MYQLYMQHQSLTVEIVFLPESLLICYNAPQQHMQFCDFNQSRDLIYRRPALIVVRMTDSQFVFHKAHFVN